MRGRRQPEIIAGRVNADGTIAAGDGFTVQKTGVGSYILTFPSGFRLISITGNNWTGNNYVILFGSPSERMVGVFGNISNTAAAVDTSFAFIAVGVQQ